MVATPKPDEATKIVDAVVSRLQEAFPPHHPSTSPVHEVSGRMSEVSNGQHQALRVEIEGVKGQFHDFREETNARFSSLSSDIRELSNALGRFIQSQSSRGGESIKGFLGLAVGAVGVTLTILTAFGSLAKTNIDTNITYTNEKIGSTNVLIDKVANTVRDLATATVPRYELDFRFGAMEKRLDHKISSDVFDKATEMRNDQISSLRDQLKDTEDRLAALREQSASKGELQSLNERMTTLSNRLSGFAEKFTAVPKDPRLQ